MKNIMPALHTFAKTRLYVMLAIILDLEEEAEIQDFTLNLRIYC